MAQSLCIVGQSIGLGNAARIEPNAPRFGFYFVRCNHCRLFFQGNVYKYLCRGFLLKFRKSFFLFFVHFF